MRTMPVPARIIQTSPECPVAGKRGTASIPQRSMTVSTCHGPKRTPTTDHAKFVPTGPSLGGGTTLPTEIGCPANPPPWVLVRYNKAVKSASRVALNDSTTLDRGSVPQSKVTVACHDGSFSITTEVGGATVVGSVVVVVCAIVVVSVPVAVSAAAMSASPTEPPRATITTNHQQRTRLTCGT